MPSLVHCWGTRPAACKQSLQPVCVGLVNPLNSYPATAFSRTWTFTRMMTRDGWSRIFCWFSFLDEMVQAMRVLVINACILLFKRFVSDLHLITLSIQVHKRQSFCAMPRYIPTEWSCFDENLSCFNAISIELNVSNGHVITRSKGLV